MPEYAVGSVVQLKSGGAAMTVTHCDDQEVCCKWHTDGGNPMRDSFPVGAVQPVPVAPPAAPAEVPEVPGPPTLVQLVDGQQVELVLGEVADLPMMGDGEEKVERLRVTGTASTQGVVHQVEVVLARIQRASVQPGPWQADGLFSSWKIAPEPASLGLVHSILGGMQKLAEM